MKFRLHPVFVLYCLVFVVRGEAVLLVMYLMCLIVHELAHADVAAKFGYRLDTITFLPYGAKVSGNIEGIAPTGEIFVALAGPMINLALALVGVALWWIIPSLYSVTLCFVQANLAISLFNLIPIRPLDGGRVLSAILQKYFPSKNVSMIMRIGSITFAILLSIISAFGVLFGITMNLIFIAMFFSMSVIVSFDSDTYSRLLEKTYRSNGIKKGMNVRYTAVNQGMPVRSVLKLINAKHYNIFLIMNENLEQVASLSETELDFVLQSVDPADTIKHALCLYKSNETNK